MYAMQWVYAAFGLLMILVGSFAVCIALFGKIDGRWLTRLGAVLFTVAFMGFGVLMAWPIFAGIGDLLSGTHHAHEMILAQRATDEESKRTEYLWFRKSLQGGAIVFAAAAPLLFWGMRRRDTGSLRPWVVLAAGLCAGYVVLVKSGLHLLPSGFGGDLIERPLRGWLSHHEALLFFGLYIVIFFLAGLAGANFTGLPVGPWTAFFVPVAALPCVASYYLNFSWWKQTLCWLLTVFLGLILNEVRKAEHQGEMAKRAARASALSSRLLEAHEGSHPPFALYLRPFVSTGKLDTQYVSEEADALDLETVLSYAVMPKLCLIGLNRPQEQAIVGAGYVYGADQGWFDRFQKLARSATAIFLFPSARAGTLDEMQWIIDNRAFGKCVFLMPETVTGKGYQAYASSPSPVRLYEERMYDHAPDWARTRAAVFERVKIRLPEYQGSGAAFTLDENRGVQQMEPLLLSRSIMKVMRLRKVIRRVLRPKEFRKASLDGIGRLESPLGLQNADPKNDNTVEERSR